MSQVVKLVIWDLDDTFWRGTLSEGGVTLDEANAELVRTLAARGIVSSICSRNDFPAAEEKLKQFGVWDLFVCPVIQWAAKGEAIKQLIERVNLRPENVLFVDDNPTNLAEARYHCPGIMCLPSPRQLAESLKSEFLRGSPDPGLTRLQQYRLLETRTASQAATPLTNDEFLRQSDITVEFDYDVELHLDRIIELLNHTNQLNFTKRRIASDEDRPVGWWHHVRGLDVTITLTCTNFRARNDFASFYKTYGAI